MSWFPDLSAYTYSPFSLPGTLNVGWLEPGHPFPTGPAPEAFLARLAELEEAAVNRTRGPHPCGFCPPGGVIRCGSAELHLAAADGRVYAAPSLVVHYVRDHGYLPPAEFVAAVMDGVPVDPEPDDPDEVLARTLVHQARRLIGRDPGRAGILLRVVLSKFAQTGAAAEAGRLLGGVVWPPGSLDAR